MRKVRRLFAVAIVICIVFAITTDSYALGSTTFEAVLNGTQSVISAPETPNGSDVPYIQYYPLSSQKIAEANNECDPLSTNDYKFREPTSSYNCHSYAWHSQDESNSYWIPYPTLYYTDGSYYAVTTPQIGDIICYYDNNGTATTGDDENLHSGIVVGTSGVTTSNGLCGTSDLYIVESKWGAAGLYRHNGYECPYTSYDDGTADYVKYYRLNSSHTHSFTSSYEYLDDYYHECYCSCGRMIHDEHDWTAVQGTAAASVQPNYVPLVVCRDCGVERLNTPGLT